jgi:hypothetical protein
MAYEKVIEIDPSQGFGSVSSQKLLACEKNPPFAYEYHTFKIGWGLIDALRHFVSHGKWELLYMNLLSNFWKVE